MRYLADILTLSRFVLAVALLVMGASKVDAGAGFMVFVVAELTDAFDGTLATRYPFPKGKVPKYRKYAAKYDMLADVLTAFAAVMFLILRVNLVAGIIMLVSYGAVALVADLVVYGKLLGHPDDCARSSLMRRNFPLAKKIIMARRMVYLALIGVVAIWMLYTSNWWLIVKIVVTIVAVLVAVFLWFFLAQRRHHISRDAVEIEEKLTKKK